jgi:hypothetical protein
MSETHLNAPHDRPLRVRNLRGTSRLHCWCASWLEHWRLGAGGTRYFCAVVGCSRRAEVGAHVKPIDPSLGRAYWIAPFCKGCNHWRNRTALAIDRRTWLVRANVSLTCAVW